MKTEIFIVTVPKWCLFHRTASFLTLRVTGGSRTEWCGSGWCVVMRTAQQTGPYTDPAAFEVSLIRSNNSLPPSKSWLDSGKLILFCLRGGDLHNTVPGKAPYSTSLTCTDLWHSLYILLGKKIEKTALWQETHQRGKLLNLYCPRVRYMSPATQSTTPPNIRDIIYLLLGRYVGYGFLLQRYQHHTL